MPMPEGWTRDECVGKVNAVDYHGPCWVAVNAHAVYIHSGADWLIGYATGRYVEAKEIDEERRG